MPLIIVVNHLQVPPEAAERVETGFRHASGMKEVPGCLGFEFWRSQDGGEYQVVTR
jgi:heme-degrading monooxygenase HmoA